MSRQLSLSSCFSTRSGGNASTSNPEPPSTSSAPDCSTPDSATPAKVARTGAFNQKWLTDFKWLEYDAAKDEVSCSMCRNAKKRNEFAASKLKPGGGWKKDHLRIHAAGRDHQNAVRESVLAHDWQRSQRTAVTKAAIGTMALMKNVLFVIQSEISSHRTSQIHQLVDDQVSSSVGTKGSEGQNLPKSHRSNFATNSFIHAMAQFARQEDDKALKASHCFTLHVDESTDIQHAKSLLIYVQFVDTQKAEVIQKHFELVGLEGTTAADITSAIMSAFDKRQIDLKKMVMFTSDGAAVMLGQENGVVKRLQRALDSAEYLVEFHCIAHREALAMKDAFGISDYFTQYELYLKDLIGYLSTHKHTTELKSVAAALELELVSMDRIFEIRWLSRCNVVNALARNLPAIQAYLADSSKRLDSARGLYKRVTSPAFVFCLGHLADILAILAQLNKFFQRSLLHPSQVESKMQAVIDSLKSSYIAPSHPVSGVQASRFSKLIAEGTMEAHRNANTPEDRSEADAETELHFLVSAIVECLQSRLEDSHDVLKAAEVFDSTKCPKSTNMATYGVTQVTFLASTYARFGVDTDGALSEWAVFKFQFLGSACHSDTTCVDVLKRCIMEAEDCPNLSILAEILLCFNSSNALVERGFSLYNRLKCKVRNRLLTAEIDRRMTLCLNASSYEAFDYSSAYTVWLSCADRGRYNVGTDCSSVKASTSASSENVAIELETDSDSD